MYPNEELQPCFPKRTSDSPSRKWWLHQKASPWRLSPDLHSSRKRKSSNELHTTWQGKNWQKECCVWIWDLNLNHWTHWLHCSFWREVSEPWFLNWCSCWNVVSESRIVAESGFDHHRMLLACKRLWLPKTSPNVNSTLGSWNLATWKSARTMHTQRCKATLSSTLLV